MILKVRRKLSKVYHLVHISWFRIPKKLLLPKCCTFCNIEEMSHQKEINFVEEIKKKYVKSVINTYWSPINFKISLFFSHHPSCQRCSKTFIMCPIILIYVCICIYVYCIHFPKSFSILPFLHSIQCKKTLFLNKCSDRWNGCYNCI